MPSSFAFPRRLMPVLIITAVIALYAGTLRLPFRDPDQACYFAELNGDYSLNNALKLTDYGLTRRFWKGDEILYRPLLFTGLALESHFFTYHAVYWNTANLAVHLLVLLLLYFLLRRISPSIYAGLFTLLFAVSGAPSGLVLNPHLNGYLLAFACLLGAYLFLLRMISSGKQTSQDLAGYFLCATAGCFLYEFLFFFVLASFPLFSGSGSRKTPARIRFLWLSPLLVYLCFYAFRKFGATTHFFYIDNRETDTFLGLGNLAQTPYDIKRMLSDFSRNILPGLRLNKILLLAGFCAVFFPGLRYLNRPFPLKLRLFPFVLLSLYVLLLAYLRGTFFREYYPYLFYLLLTLGIYGLIDFKRISGWKHLPPAILMTAMILWNAFHTGAFLKGKTEGYRDIGAYFEKLGSFVESHRDEKGFSFHIEKADPEIDWPINLREGYPRESNPDIYIPFSKILFRPYVSEDRPRYTLEWNPKISSFAVTPND